MNSVAVAEGALLEDVLDATFPLWNDGLSRPAYSQWNTAQLRTPWGRERLQRFVLVDTAGRWLSAAKRYRFTIRLNGRELTMCGVGAVFTRAELRGRGYARELLERMLIREAAEGVAAAALFSEIGPMYYERLGFTALPLDEVTVTVHTKAGAPAMLVRAGNERDYPALARMHDTRSNAARLALRRDEPYLHYAISKRRLFSALSASGARALQFFVAEEGATAVAYAVIGESEGGWTFEEGGDRDPSAARLGALLQVLLARDPSRPPPLMRAWWPASFPAPPQVRLSDRTPARDLFMVRPLGDFEMPARGDDVFYWRCDSF